MRNRGSDRRVASDGSRKVPVLRRYVVLDLALAALTIAVFVVLALVLKGLERL